MAQPDKLVTIKQLPQDERPREKLALRGSDALSDAELLAIVLHTGSRHKTAVGLAQELLSKTNGLPGLVRASTAQLQETNGIGHAKALTLQAVLALARRLAAVSNPVGLVIQSPADVANYLMPKLRYLDKEYFVALLLNTKNRVIDHDVVVSMGSLQASIVHPRELFKEAIRRSAAAVIVAHNHPSGDPEPSTEDIMVTKRLMDAGKLLDIAVLDHVIIGDGKYVSLKEKGIL